MFPQIACLRWYIVTLVAFVRLLSIVCFHMCPQSTCIRRCKVTLVAFVWLFCTVCFQMCPQIACLRGWIVTLVAEVWLFSIVFFFQMIPQIACMRRRIVTLDGWMDLFDLKTLSVFFSGFLNLHSYYWNFQALDQLLLSEIYNYWLLFNNHYHFSILNFHFLIIRR